MLRVTSYVLSVKFNESDAVRQLGLFGFVGFIGFIRLLSALSHA